MIPKVIAIDGYSSTGKSSVAKQIARELDYIHIDTGAMYRAVTLFALEHGFVDENGISNTQELISALNEISLDFQYNETTYKNEIILNDVNVEEQIRTMHVSNSVSHIAKIPEVRKHLVKIQRGLAVSKGIVMDGRDIGTVVFPDAPVKIFLTASAKIRAKRRYDELKSKGLEITLEEVEENINTRDLIDTQRATSPLIKADDAIEVNNDNLNQQQTFEAVLKIIRDTFNLLKISY